MLVHLAIPAFHAAVHQAATPVLRGRPVAVAVDGTDQAPLFAVSLEGRAAGVHPGLRAQAARRRCPGLVVLPPDPPLYRRAHQALAGLATTYTPRVAGRAGHWDLDLTGTERLWGSRLTPGSRISDPLAQAGRIARTLVQACRHQLRLTAFAGAGARLASARLASRLARDSDDARVGVVSIPPEREDALIGPLPLAWLPDCPRTATDTLAACGITTIAAARALGPEALADLLGEEAGPLLAALGARDEAVVPEIADPEPSVSVACHCGTGGADDDRAALLLARLGRELGYALRARTLACSTVSLEARWLDGRGLSCLHHARRQLRHDDELAAVAVDLAGRRARRVRWERFTLVASGLCAAEEQLELFLPQRAHRLEDARDALRRRFGAEMVTPLRQAV